MDPSSPAPQATSLAGFLCRIFWMTFGPGLLLLDAVIIARPKHPGLGLADLLFGLGWLALLGTRAADFAWFGGKDSDGKPATREGVLRWLAVAAFAGVALYGLARGAAYLFAG